jgi:prepilin-type N-terminal cleavage/methylation domain-containing protein
MKKTSLGVRIQKSEVNNNKNILSSIFRLISSSGRAAGFTLVEVLVAATILATLVGGVLLTLNPIEQINKGQDAQRMSDLQAVKTALDLYYNDTGCYPTADDGNPGTSGDGVPFGNEWRISNTVYMKEVPEDPSCQGGAEGICYRYRTDSNSTCPQWNVVFAELSTNSDFVDACPLSTLAEECTPEGYEDGKFACVMSGGVDCGDLLAASLLGGIETTNPTSTPTPGPPTPTPTPDPNDVTFPLPADTNPDPYEVTLNPMYPIPGSGQTFRVKVDDPGVEIQSVEVVVTSDGGVQHSVFLNEPSGTQNKSGTWTGSRVVGSQETFYDLYVLEFFVTAGTAPNEIVGSEALPLAASGE